MNILSLINSRAKLLSLSLVLSTSLVAQEIDSTSITTDRLELYKQSNLWLGALNAAGANLLETINYTNVSGGFTQTKGDFRQQQEGEKNNGFLFQAEGATNLKGAYLWGKFSLETEKKKNSRFNASIIDPFRGMPFIIADDRSSDWRLQYYNLETRIAFPKLLDKLYTGLGINYNVSTGAKQLDPRPLNRYYALELTPSVVYAFDDKHNIGGVFYYKNMHETSSVELRNSYQPATFYFLEGLGAFKQTTGIGTSRDYSGNAFGGEIQYFIKTENTNFMLSGGYIYDYENVIDGNIQPVNISKAVRDNYWANVSYTFQSNKLSHKIEAGATHQNINGIFYDKIKDPEDPVISQIVLNKKTRSKFKTTQYNLKYDLFRLNQTGYLWNLGTNMKHYVQRDKYLLPSPGVDASFQNINRYDFELHGKYNFNKKMPFDGQLLLGVSTLYSLANDCKLSYGGGKEDHVVFKELLHPDFLFLSKNYWKFAGSMQYSIPFTINSKNVNTYAKVDAFLIPNTNLGKRSNFTVSLGFIL